MSRSISNLPQSIETTPRTPSKLSSLSSSRQNSLGTLNLQASGSTTTSTHSLSNATAGLGSFDSLPSDSSDHDITLALSKTSLRTLTRNATSIPLPTPTQDEASPLFRLRSLSSRQDNKENVHVTVRMRPLTATELRSSTSVAWDVNEELCKIIPLEAVSDSLRRGSNLVKVDSLRRISTAPSSPIPGGSVSSPEYTFDHAFQGSANQPIYDTSVRNLVYSTMEGYNGTVFAYGQTSSGKTYTMMGNDTEPGVIPQAVHDVFQYIKLSEGQREYLLRVSYIEIYNESIRDLLSPDSRDLRVHEDKKRGIYVSPLKEEIVTSPTQVMSIISRGEANRHVSTTDYNEHSSRSHTLFQLVVESREFPSPLRKNTSVKISMLNLIDLAGSEKAATNVDRRKEGSYINKSLLTLGSVIAKLTEDTTSHIPYRDSKLTRILQSSLSGNARVSVICTISPSSNNIEESVSTLKFAARVKKIVTRAHTNHILDDKGLLQKYRKEIQDLKMQLVSANESFERERQQEMKQVLAEKEKFEEELHEQQLLRTTLKARIGDLTRLILTAGSLNQNHAPSSPPSPDSTRPLERNPDSPESAAPLQVGMLTNELLAKDVEISQLSSKLRSLEGHMSLSAAGSRNSINNTLEDATPLTNHHSNSSSIESLDVNSELVRLKQRNRELEIVAEDAEERYALIITDYDRDRESWEIMRRGFVDQTQLLKSQLVTMHAQLQAYEISKFEKIETEITMDDLRTRLESEVSNRAEEQARYCSQLSAVESELSLTKAELNVARLHP